MQLFQVDAFTAERFKGNPAGVCLLEEERSAEWMQLVAAEMNLSETAFLRPAAGAYELRWFTPTVEVDLCGHATLASAHVLFGEDLAENEVRFATASGELVASRFEDAIALDFPALAANEVAAPEGLDGALGVSATAVSTSRFDWLVELASDAEVRSLKPDLARIAALEARAVIVTARSDAPFDFVSRVFGPRVGIDEDPVTGSAHCVLGPYWSARLGRDDLYGYQASARGGTVRVRVGAERVELIGTAVTVFRTEID